MGSGQPRDMAGVAVCAWCNSDEFEPTRVTGRGMHVGYWSRSKDGSVSSRLKEIAQDTHYTMTILVEVPHPSDIHAKMQYEGFNAKLHKLFAHEIQIGDKTFDDLVWIKTNTPETTRAFLSLGSVQRAISELIEMKAEIEIDEARVYVKAVSSGKMIAKDFVLYTAVLGHHLNEFSKP
jgi:hypothetical protein